MRILLSLAILGGWGYYCLYRVEMKYDGDSVVRSRRVLATVAALVLVLLLWTVLPAGSDQQEASSPKPSVAHQPPEPAAKSPPTAAKTPSVTASKQCRTLKRSLIRLKGPRRIGPKAKGTGTYRVQGVRHDRNGSVVFFVDGEERKVDRTQPFSYTLEASRLKIGRHRLTIKVHETALQCSGPRTSTERVFVRQLTIRRLKPPVVRRPKKREAIVLAPRPRPAVRPPAPVVRPRPAPRPAPKTTPKTEKSPPRRAEPYDLGG